MESVGKADERGPEVAGSPLKAYATSSSSLKIGCQSTLVTEKPWRRGCTRTEPPGKADGGKGVEVEKEFEDVWKVTSRAGD